MDGDPNSACTRDVEITLEVNPDDLGGNRINELIAAGVNRFSIGVQVKLNLIPSYSESLQVFLIINIIVQTHNSFHLFPQALNNDDLLILNRNHDSQAAFLAIEKALDQNSSNKYSVSVDLIFGRPGQSLKGKTSISPFHLQKIS